MGMIIFAVFIMGGGVVALSRFLGWPKALFFGATVLGLVIAVVVVSRSFDGERERVNDNVRISLKTDQYLDKSNKPYTGSFAFEKGGYYIECAVTDGLLDGLIKLSRSGGDRIEVFYVRGVLNGSLKTFGKYNSLKSEIIYANGLISSAKYYNEAGRIEKEVTYRDGKPTQGYIVRQGRSETMAPEELSTAARVEEDVRQNLEALL